MERHRAEITGIACARGSGPASFVVSASKDMSCSVWNPYDGTVLKTFVFSLLPTCVALDPADRGFYSGFEDGTVQMVEFSAEPSQQTRSVTNGSTTTMEEDDRTEDTAYENRLFSGGNVPFSVSESRWSAEGHDAAVLAVDVVFEGNLVLTGDAKGNVAVWDVATGHLFRVLAKHKAPVTNIKILPPTGFPKTAADKTPATTTIQTSIVQPRYRNIVRREDVSTLPPITIGFNGTLPPSDFSHFGSSFNDIFSPPADMDAISRGLKAFSSKQEVKVVKEEDTEKVQRLEKELADMHEKYERLNDIQKRTWEEHSKWMMAVDAEKADADERT